MDDLSDATSEVLITSSRDESGNPVLSLRGELDFSNADELRRTVEQLVGERPPRLTFDLRGLSFMDSSGISAMVLAANQIPQVVVLNPSSIVRRVLDVTGLIGVLDVT